MRVVSIFAGIGGFDLAAEWVGFKIVGQVENNAFCISVLEKHWPDVKRIKDIRDVKGDEFGSVDLLCGGPPCQPASCAGKRRGTEDDRWLWDETLRVAKAIKPRWCLFENPTGILSLQGGVPFEHLLLNLEAQGFSVQTIILPACAINAPHRRDRVWIVASREGAKCELSGTAWARREGFADNGCFTADTESRETFPAEPGGLHAEPCGPDSDASDASNEGLQEQGQATHGSAAEYNHAWNEPWPEVAARLCSVDVRLPGGLARPKGWRVNALKAVGNSIVPQVVCEIMKCIKKYRR